MNLALIIFLSVTGHNSHFTKISVYIEVFFTYVNQLQVGI